MFNAVIMLRFIFSFSIGIHKIAVRGYTFRLLRFLESEWGIGRDGIVNIIKLLVHPEVGILDNPRVRRLSYNRAHRCLLFADIVHANWSLGRYWRSSPGSDSTMRYIMLFHLPFLHHLLLSSSKADPRPY